MQHVEELISSGAIPALINMTNNHFDKPDVIQYAMKMFENLSKHSETTVNLLIVSNLPDVIFKVINANKTHKKTLEMSLIIINNLIITHPSILTKDRLDMLLTVINFVGIDISAAGEQNEINDPLPPVIVNENDDS
jgi:hypothetical protein